MTKGSIWTRVPLLFLRSLLFKLRGKQAGIWVSEARIWVSETNFLVSEAMISVSEVRNYPSSTPLNLAVPLINIRMEL